MSSPEFKLLQLRLRGTRWTRSMPAGAAARKDLGIGIRSAQCPIGIHLQNRLIGPKITGSELVIIERRRAADLDPA
jgi:hypothetical protein